VVKTRMTRCLGQDRPVPPCRLPTGGSRITRFLVSTNIEAVGDRDQLAAVPPQLVDHLEGVADAAPGEPVEAVDVEAGDTTFPRGLAELLQARGAPECGRSACRCTSR
jgi:hypothetical protein